MLYLGSEKFFTRPAPVEFVIENQILLHGNIRAKLRLFTIVAIYFLTSSAVLVIFLPVVLTLVPTLLNLEGLKSYRYLYFLFIFLAFLIRFPSPLFIQTRRIKFLLRKLHRNLRAGRSIALVANQIFLALPYCLISGDIRWTRRKYAVTNAVLATVVASYIFRNEEITFLSGAHVEYCVQLSLSLLDIISLGGAERLFPGVYPEQVDSNGINAILSVVTAWLIAALIALSLFDNHRALLSKRLHHTGSYISLVAFLEWHAFDYLPRRTVSVVRYFEKEIEIEQNAGTENKIYPAGTRPEDIMKMARGPKFERKFFTQRETAALIYQKRRSEFYKTVGSKDIFPGEPLGVVLADEIDKVLPALLQPQLSLIGALSDTAANSKVETAAIRQADASAQTRVEGTLFGSNEIDIYCNRETGEVFMFHAKEIPDGISHLRYYADSYEIEVVYNNGRFQSFGVSVQSLIRPYFASANEAQLVRVDVNKIAVSGCFVPILKLRQKT